MGCDGCVHVGLAGLCRLGLAHTVGAGCSDAHAVLQDLLGSIFQFPLPLKSTPKLRAELSENKSETETNN